VIVSRTAPRLRHTGSLHGTIAHEMTHGLIRAHFGTLGDHRYPAELREGYCDYVAGGGSITDAEALKLQRSAPSAPALVYGPAQEGRRRARRQSRRR
jgi:hypothetical protein